jgi:hypothetical protein
LRPPDEQDLAVTGGQSSVLLVAFLFVIEGVKEAGGVIHRLIVVDG